MFAKIFTTAILAMTAISASAIDYSCNVGELTCCNSFQAPGNYNAATIAALVGASVQDITGQVGAQCNPITGIGAGTGANCAAAPVCCEKNFANQLIGVNCTPVTVGA
ncbi:hydrophobin [Panaeolus papilionaceus]|nr:hydrophobin [Panaeolus papilionaceus]